MTPPAFDQKKVVSLFAVLASLGTAALILWLLWGLRTLIPPFIVALVIALILAPEVDRLEGRKWGKWRVPRGTAISLIYILFLVFGAIAVRLLPMVSDQLTDLIKGHIPNAVLHGSGPDVVSLAARWMNRLHVPTLLRPPVLEQAQHVPQLLGRGLHYLTDNLPGIAGNLVWLVLVPVIAFFLLLDFHKILGKMLLLCPPGQRENILLVTTDVIAVFGNWVRGVLLVLTMDVAATAAVLWLAGYVLGHAHPEEASLTDYALSLAVTAGIFYTIPYFGAIVATLLIGAVTYVTHGLVPALVVTGIIVVLHQVVFDVIIAPKVIGGSVNLHPLLTLLALLAGGTLFGIGGTLLAVPIAAAAQIVLVHLFPQFKSDVVAVRRITRRVHETLDAQSEADKPSARKDGSPPAEDMGVAEDMDAPPVG